MKAKADTTYIEAVALIPYYLTLLVVEGLKLAVYWLMLQSQRCQGEPIQAASVNTTDDRKSFIAATLGAFDRCKKDDTLVACMSSIERVPKNRTALKKAKDRDGHLYAVLRPTRQEAIRRIENAISEREMAYISALYYTVIESLESV